MPPFLPQKSFRSGICYPIHTASEDATPSSSLVKIVAPPNRLCYESLLISIQCLYCLQRSKKKSAYVVPLLKNFLRGSLLPMPVWPSKPLTTGPQAASAVSPPTIPSHRLLLCWAVRTPPSLPMPLCSSMPSILLFHLFCQQTLPHSLRPSTEMPSDVQSTCSDSPGLD